MTIRVVLVDDQPLLRTGFRMILHVTDDASVVDEGADGGAAVTQVAELEPDVVLMDIRMPGWTGSRQPAGSWPWEGRLGC
jgi:YesN/AraC family two-component response regulator